MSHCEFQCLKKNPKNICTTLNLEITKIQLYILVKLGHSQIFRVIHPGIAFYRIFIMRVVWKLLKHFPLFF